MLVCYVFGQFDVMGRFPSNDENWMLNSSEHSSRDLNSAVRCWYEQCLTIGQQDKLLALKPAP